MKQSVKEEEDTMKEETTFMLGGCSEELQINSKGEYQLEIEGTTAHIKKVTPKQAKDWFEKRYPKDSWEEVVAEANEWWRDKSRSQPPSKRV